MGTTDNGNDNPGVDVTTCHATASEYNSYVVNGNVSGHADLIPPDECETPAPVTPDLILPELVCIPVGDILPTAMTVTVSEFSGIGDVPVELSVSGPGGTSSIPITGPDGHMLPLDGFGIYTVTLSQGETVFDSGTVVFKHCLPPIAPIDPEVPATVTPPASSAPPASPAPAAPAAPPASTVTAPVVAKPAPTKAPEASPELAVTGSNEPAVMGALAAGVALLLAGAVAAQGGRRRHTE